MLLNCWSPASGPSSPADLLSQLGRDRHVERGAEEVAGPLAERHGQLLLQDVAHRPVKFLRLRHRHPVDLDAGDGQPGAREDVEDVARTAAGELEVVGLDDDQGPLVLRVARGGHDLFQQAAVGVAVLGPNAKLRPRLLEIGRGEHGGLEVADRAVAVEDDVAVGVADRLAPETVRLEGTDRLADAAQPRSRRGRGGS